MTFDKWLETFIEEKEIDIFRTFSIEDDYGLSHTMPVGVVVEYFQGLPKEEQAQIKSTIVAIDFRNGDVYHFFEYVAKFIANDYSGALREEQDEA